MSEISFFMGWADTRSFVAFLVEQFGADFALDQSPTPDPPVLRSAAEVHSVVTADPLSPRFFVTSSQWRRFPLSVTETHTNDGRHFFSIDQRYGGPAFDFKVARVDGERVIVPGWFIDYPYYYCRKNGFETFDRPALLPQRFSRCDATCDGTALGRFVEKWARLGLGFCQVQQDSMHKEVGCARAIGISTRLMRPKP